MPQEFLKHAVPDYLARGTDLYFLRLLDKKKKKTTAKATTAIQWERPVLNRKYMSCNRVTSDWSRHIIRLHLIGYFLVPESLIYKDRHLNFKKVTLGQKHVGYYYCKAKLYLIFVTLAKSAFLVCHRILEVSWCVLWGEQDWAAKAKVIWWDCPALVRSMGLIRTFWDLYSGWAPGQRHPWNKWQGLLTQFIFKTNCFLPHSRQTHLGECGQSCSVSSLPSRRAASSPSVPRSRLRGCAGGEFWLRAVLSRRCAIQASRCRQPPHLTPTTCAWRWWHFSNVTISCGAANMH